jgi:hypothetical protein
MRTRIALVAIVSIALITVTLLSQLVSVQPARAAIAAPHPSTSSAGNGRHDQLTSDVSSTSKATPPSTTPSTTTPLRLGVDLLVGKPAGTKEVAPVAPPAPADTVTPAQRAAWERVAMCEEGGNWHSDGSRFSGGLGITRANWAEYGGLQYASEGALATPDQQIMVAERIQSYPPDQGGCRGW